MVLFFTRPILDFIDGEVTLAEVSEFYVALPSKQTAFFAEFGIHGYSGIDKNEVTQEK